MVGQIIALIREARGKSDHQETDKFFPVGSSAAARRRTSTASLRDEGLLGVMSQLAWQTDLDLGQSLPSVLFHNTRCQPCVAADDSGVSAVRESEGHVQGQASGSCLATLTGGGSEEQSMNNDVMHDVDRHGRRRHRRARRKSRRHRHQRDQQTLVNSSMIATVHQSADIVTSSLAAPSSL